MKKVTGLIYLGIFLAVLLVPLCLTNTKENVISEIDNRKLVEKPVFGTVGYTDATEAYLQDRIGLRNEMVNAYALLNDAVGKELTHPVYTYGQDGYVFFNMHNNIVFNDYHKAFAEMVYKMQEYCESRGTRFYFMFEPEKTSVLRRFLPKGVNYDDAWVDEMISYMEGLGVHCINNTELLTEKSYTEEVFNKQYDAGHWNDLGCFYATNHLFATIHEDIPAVTEMDLDEFEIDTKVVTTLPISEFPISEEVPVFTIKSDYVNVSDGYADKVEVDSNYHYFHYLINKSENAEDLPRALFFQGSYYNRNKDFFVSRTSEDIAVHNYQNVMNLDYYYNLFQPEVVVLEVGEYTLTDQYFDSSKMGDIDWNPALIDLSEDATYDEQIQSILADTDVFHADVHANLISNALIDSIYIDRIFSDSRYAYLVTDHQIYDLQENKCGLLSTSLEHGEISEGDEVIVYLEDYDGKCYYMPLSVRKTSDCMSALETSEHIEFNSDQDQYIFTTDERGNRFSAVVLQLYGNEDEYLEGLLESYDTGLYQGHYTHDKESGWYKFRLRANSNIKDEYMEYRVYLTKGETYYYMFDIDAITDKKVSVNDFQVFGYNK